MQAQLQDQGGDKAGAFGAAGGCERHVEPPTPAGQQGQAGDCHRFRCAGAARMFAGPSLLCKLTSGCARRDAG